MIDVSELVFEYPGHRALDGVSLHLPAGSVTALVGPNGAGKSTLLRCMAGLDQPLSGQITVHGISVQDQPREVHRQLGYLSDFYGLYEGLSVARCLQYAARAMGLPAQDAQARAHAVAAQLGLSELLGRLPSDLSRGQRQRVAIGQAIAHQPRVLLLDEPASGLDPEARSSLSALFLQLQAQGMTLVVSSHILSELDEYCTHILSLRQGRIESHEALHSAHGQATPAGAGLQEHAATADGARQLYALELAAPIAATDPADSQHRLRAALRDQLALADEDMPLLDASGAQPSQLWLPTAAAPRAALIAQLVQAGWPVAGLWPLRERLQDRYARSAQAARHSAPPLAHAPRAQDPS